MDRTGEARFEVAELRLDRPALAQRWRRPGRVEVIGERIVWSGSWPAPFPLARPSRSMMLRFVELANGSEADIAAYVRHWGSLTLEAEPAGYWTVDPPGELRPARHAIAARPAFAEPAAVYRREATRVAAILDCAAELYQGSVAHADRWAAFRMPQRFMEPVAVPRPASLVMAHGVLAWQATQLQRDYAAFPVVEPVLRDGRSFRVNVAGARSGLAGALAYQVLVALARGEPFGWCDIIGCQSPGVRRAHGRWYCEAHDSAAAKNANRQRRFRMRTATS